MREPTDVIDRGIPDLLDTASMPRALAAEVDHLAGRTEPWEADSAVHPAVRARALVAAGDSQAARAALAECEGAGFEGAGFEGTGLESAEWGPQSLSAACWAVSRVGAAGLVDRLAASVALLPEGFLVEDGVPIGATASLRGLLAIARGDLPLACEELAAAVRIGDERAPVWGALARVELARVLLTRAQLGHDEVDGAAEAARMLGSARAFFEAGAYGHLAEVTMRLALPTHAVEVAEPRSGHLVEVGEGAAGEVRAGEWTVGFGVQPPVRVADRLGLRAVRHLIRNRDRRVPAIELEAVLEGRTLDVMAEVDRALLESEVGLEDADLTGRLRDLLLDDRARSRISKLVRRTVTALGESHPVLGEHLECTVSTGYACRYEADPDVRWVLAAAESTSTR